MRKFCGIVDGEKARELTESSGGDVTSKSFMGFALLGVGVEPKPPSVLWLNIAAGEETGQQKLIGYMKKTEINQENFVCCWVEKLVEI